MGQASRDEILSTTLDEQQGDLIFKLMNMHAQSEKTLTVQSVTVMKVMLRSIVLSLNNLEAAIDGDPKIVNFGNWLAVPQCTHEREEPEYFG